MTALEQGIDFAQKGGWTMVPLGLCAVAGLAVALERAFALRRRRVIPQSLVDMLDMFQGESSVDPMLQACRHSRNSLARLIEGLLFARRQSPAHITDTLHAMGRREVERLERGLLVLEIVAGVGPLLGLLGTVLGMVSVFDAITAEGLGNAQVLSSGISEALITTVTGLIVGIPALALYSYFSKRAESLAIELHELGTSFVARLVETLQRKNIEPFEGRDAQSAGGPR